jgi:hypothetical protein
MQEEILPNCDEFFEEYLIMAVNSVSPGSYNSPSVQPQAQAQPAREKKSEAKHEEPRKTPPAEHSAPSVNTSGQKVGTIINTKA